MRAFRDYQLLNQAEWSRIASLTKTVQVNRSDVISGRFGVSGDIYFLRSGRLQAVNAKGLDAHIPPGMFFDESYVWPWQNHHRLARHSSEGLNNIIADERCELRVLSKGIVESLTGSGDDFWARLLELPRFRLTKSSHLDKSSARSLENAIVEMAAGEFTFEKLDTESDLFLCKKLLYEVYIEEQGWNLVQENASGIRVETLVNELIS